MGALRLASRHHGDGFHLDQELGTKERGHLDRGTRGRILDVDELVAHLAILQQARAVEDVHVQLNDVGKRSSGSFHGGLEILEDLLCLRAEIAGAHQMAGSAKRYLSCDEYGRATVYSCQVGVAVGPMHGYRR